MAILCHSMVCTGNMKVVKCIFDGFQVVLFTN